MMINSPRLTPLRAAYFANAILLQTAILFTPQAAVIDFNIGVNSSWYFASACSILVLLINIALPKQDRKQYAWCVFSTVLSLLIIFQLSGSREGYLCRLKP